MKRPVSIYDGTFTEEDLEQVLASHTQDGLMSKEDKIKLDSLSGGGGEGGGGTIESLEASKVVQDATHRFVTDVEKTTWNAKASTDKVDSSKDGLMSKEDKAKLDGIAANANNYVHPESHPASMIVEDAEHRFVTDAEKATWGAAATKESIGLGNVTNDAQVKRSEMGVANGVATLDNEGKVPAAQLPSYVDDVVEVANFEALPETGEAGKIYVAMDTSMTYRWTGSAYAPIPTSIALGETSSTAYAGDKGKANADEIAKIKDGTTVVPKAADAATVDGFTVEANVPADAKFTDTVYEHPSTHEATIITEDETHRFVTDTEKSTWNNKADKTVATSDTDGLMAATDKAKLDLVEAEANKYVHPETHPASMIVEDDTHKFVTAEQITAWDSKTDPTVATTEEDGLMSAADKAKLDAIEAEANKYEHPAEHPATMITEDDDHKFVTTAQIASWDAKAGSDVATTEANGLMSMTDKAKLDSVAEGANNYVHPDTHEATMITEDETHRFVTDTEKATWNAKADATVVTTGADGLMSATDKIKLDTVAEGANNYVHPDDENTRHVTDAQIAAWNAKADAAVATPEVNGLMVASDKAKLDAVEAEANKYEHPASHPATMITEDETHRFVTDEEKVAWNTPVTKESLELGNVTNDAQVKRSEMGVANGVATLDTEGKVPAAQLPSYVDDVIEVANFEALPETGESGKIYIAADTNMSYRWTGTQYAPIPTSLALGETASTAYAGDKGKAVTDEVNKIKDGTTTVPKAADAATVDGFTVEANVPADAKFTDTTYTDVTADASGLMTAADKVKLDAIEAEANKYVHPETHDAAMIVEDETHKFVTDEEKETWSGKADVTPTTPHLDEPYGVFACGTAITVEEASTGVGLDIKWSDTTGQHTLTVPSGVNIYGGGNALESPANYPSSTITVNSGIVKNVIGGGLGGNVGNATVIINGGTFSVNSAAVIMGAMAYDDVSKQVVGGDVGSAELIINNTNNEIFLVYGGGQGYSTVGKTKLVLNGGRMNYVTAGGSNGHTGIGEVIVNGGTIKVLQGCNRGTVGNIKLTVNDGTINNMYAGGETGDSSVDATYSKAEVFINGGTITNISSGKNGTVASADKLSGAYMEGVISDEVATAMNLTKISSTPVATTEVDGLMSSEDKTKLDTVAEGANNYTHPENHAATMITEDETHRFVTDTEKATWNAKASTTVATGEADGLMSAADKAKLDLVEAEANKYEHPAEHPATMITEDDDHKFVTAAQITAWDAKAGSDVATTEAAGLMSSEDKTKLDGMVNVPVNFELVRNSNYLNLSYGNPKELKAKFYIPEAQFAGSQCFVTNELASFYGDLGGAPASYNMQSWASTGMDVSELTAENGPYLVLCTMNLGEELGSSSSIVLEQYVTSLKPYFEDYIKSAEMNTKEFAELQTTSKTIVGAINELKAAIDALNTTE